MPSHKNDIILFIERASFIVLPILLFLGFPTYVMFRFGELTSIDKVIDHQKQNKNLVVLGLAYSNSEIYYKLRSVIKRQPDIIALGTSRVLSFSSNFFNKNTHFFNAGRGANKLEHYVRFLDKIPYGKEPQIIIMGVDQYFFNDSFNNNFRSEDNFEQIFQNGGSAGHKLKNSYVKIYSDFLDGTLQISDLKKQKNTFEAFGINAYLHQFGYRNDGSIYTNSPYSKKDSLFKDTFHRIDNGISRFEYGQHVSDKSLIELDMFLAKCKKRNIYVVGFLPPFASAVLIKMQNMKNKYQYMSLLKPSINPIFAKYNFSFFDFSTIVSLGAQDIEFIDGFHGSEKAYLRLFIKMLEEDKKLQEYANIEFLKISLKQTNSNYIVFK